MATKDITVQGVTLRLYKMNAFEQQKLLELVAPAVGAVLANSGAASREPSYVVMGTAVVTLFDAIPENVRHRLIWDMLLAPSQVKIVVSGTEMPLIGKAENGAVAVMNDNLSDFADLLEVAIESFNFNLERFFTKGAALAQLAAKFKQA